MSHSGGRDQIDLLLAPLRQAQFTSKVEQQPAPLVEQERIDFSRSFIPSNKYIGSKPGYYFGTNDDGLGYHIDKKSAMYLKQKIEASESGDRKRVRVEKQEKSIEQLLNEAEESGIAPLDKNSLKVLIATLERKITKNQETRVKFAQTPEKFLDSELELHSAIEELYVVAASPELFPFLIGSGGFSSLLNLVIHENTDISLAVVTLFQEICDSEMIQEADQTENDDAVIASSIVNAFIASQGLEILVQNLSRLNESNTEDATGVYNTLSILENLVELDGQIALELCEKTHFLKYLLKRLKVREYDANKLYCSELLSVLLQTDPSIPRKVCNMHDVDGLEELMQIIAPYRKQDPSSYEEQECVQNIFQALYSVLLEFDHQELFRKGEGIELLLRFIKDQKYATVCAIKALKFALTGNKSNCIKLVEVGGLKHIFPILMGRGIPKICFQGNESSFDKHDAEAAVVAIISQLCTFLYDVEEKDCLPRLIIKFTETEGEKLGRCIELFGKYHKSLQETDKKIQKAVRALEAEGDDEELEIYSSSIPSLRIEGGLYQLQQISAVICFVCVHFPKAASVAQAKLNSLGYSIEDVATVLKENAVEILAEVNTDDEVAVDNKAILLNQIGTLYQTWSSSLLPGYLRQIDDKLTTSTGRETSSGGFLSKSMEELLKESEELQAANLRRKAEYERRKREIGNPIESLYPELANKQSTDSKMWVDKYSPQSFSQLLSSDTVNKEVLKTLKQWDLFVFKRPIPLCSISSSSTSAKHTHDKHSKPAAAMADHNKANEKDAEDRAAEEESDDDDGYGDRRVKEDNSFKAVSSAKKEVVDNRPEQKVILLSGPPGTGKTTLAHILARHCGYSTIEVNASDDRSADSLREILTRSMSSNTILPNQAPNCIILDEVDGIDGSGAMDALLEIINAPLAANQKSNGKNKATKPCLMRPLICICNDHYAPSLRALRPIAKVFLMDPPAVAKLVQRVKAIALREGLHLSTQSLVELCNATGNDIRSSINTLQFASLKASASAKAIARSSSDAEHENHPNQPHHDLSSTVIALVKAGLKDGQKNIFDIWQEIFNTKELAKAILARKAFKKVSAADSNAKQCAVLEIMSSEADHGDHQLILSGVQENFLNVRYHDPALVKTSAVCDWLSFADYFDQLTRVIPGGFSLLQYVYVAPAAVHVHCAQESRVRMKWPVVDKNYNYSQRQKENIIKGFVENSSNQCFQLSSKQDTVLDVIACLLDILSPAIRSFSPTSLSQQEKTVLTSVVSVMANIGLTYQPSTSKTSNGNDPLSRNSMSLEPAIDALVADFKRFATTAQNNPSLNAVNNSRHDYGWAELQNRRRYLSNEMKFFVTNQIKSHLINLRIGELQQQSGTNSSPAKALTSNESVGNNKDKARLHSYSSPQTSATLALEEEKSLKRAKLGKMDMFIKSSKQPTTGTGKKRPIDAGSEGATAFAAAAVAAAAATAKDNQLKLSKVRFKFAQGYSDAVRRPVSIAEFL